MVLLTIALTSELQSAECPIIFVHGHENEPKPSVGWRTWKNEHSAMRKILNQNYRGYTLGGLECDKTTTLPSAPSRSIYNFSFYNPDGSCGVIGDPNIVECQWGYDESDGKYKPLVQIDPFDLIDVYWEASACGTSSWAQNFADFIKEVPDKTGASKVNIVSHSMGGLVIQSGESLANKENSLYGSKEKFNARWVVIETLAGGIGEIMGIVCVCGLETLIKKSNSEYSFLGGIILGSSWGVWGAGDTGKQGGGFIPTLIGSGIGCLCSILIGQKNLPESPLDIGLIGTYMALPVVGGVIGYNISILGGAR